MNNIITVCNACGTKNKIPASKQHLKPKCGRCGTVIIINDMAIPVDLNDHIFHDFVKQASLPIMVDFFSPSCGPCQSMLPKIDTLAKRQNGNAIIAKLDTNRNPATSAFFNIRGVPSFFFFKNGELKEKVVGAVSIEVLEQKLAALT